MVYTSRTYKTQFVLDTDVHVGVDRENYFIPIKRHGEEEEQMEVNDVEEEGGKPKVSASEGPRKEKRPHVGELPSERKERMKAEGTWNPPGTIDFINQGTV